MAYGAGSRLFLLIVWIWLFSPANLSASHLVQNGGFLVVANDALLTHHNRDDRFVPASIIKLATALAALKLLGTDFRFTTDFFLDEASNLYLKGSGDPFLISEYFPEIVAALKLRGVTQINHLVIDNSRFALQAPADGTEQSINPYDAPNSASAANFNTLAIVITENRTVTSGEMQTPLLPLAKEIAEHLPQGSHRVNIDAYPSRHNLDNSERHIGELLTLFLSQVGITRHGEIRSGIVDKRWEPLYTFTSHKTLGELIRACLKYSNNFIANQIFLTCGAHLYGYPASWEKARKGVNKLLSEELQLGPEHGILHEGSGISRNTTVSPLFMLAVLNAFKPHKELMPREKGILIKSGTLTDVFCYAGYFEPWNNADPFVIMLNQKNNTRDELLSELLNKYHAIPQ